MKELGTISEARPQTYLLLGSLNLLNFFSTLVYYCQGLSQGVHWVSSSNIKKALHYLIKSAFVFTQQINRGFWISVTEGIRFYRLLHIQDTFPFSYTVLDEDMSVLRLTYSHARHPLTHAFKCCSHSSFSLKMENTLFHDSANENISSSK